MDLTTAILLAAGQGSRCLPYTATQPKACLPVANRPLIAYTIDCLRSLGVERFTVVVGHLAAQVRAAVGDRPGVTFVEQSGPPGTAFAALAARPTGDVVVACADVCMAPENWAALLAAAGNAALVAPLGQERPQDHLCAQVSDGRIVQVLGHARHAGHRLLGAYRFDAAGLRVLARNPGVMTAVPVGGMPPLEGELAQTIADLAPVQAVEAPDFAVDIDKPWHILQANRALLAYMGTRLTHNDIHPTARVSEKAIIKGPIAVGDSSVIGDAVIIEGPAWIGKNCVVDSGAILQSHVALGDGCRVVEYAKVRPYSAIGPRCQVGHVAEVGGVFMENVYALHYLDFIGVIGRSSDIGAGTVTGTLRFDDLGQPMTVKGRREVPGPWANCAYVGDFCRTGVGSILMPGVRVGPYAAVGAGALIYEDVPERTAVFVKQELERRPWGPERYGW